MSDGLVQQKYSDISVELNDLNQMCHNYIAGYICKKLNEQLFKGCQLCLDILCSDRANNLSHNIITAREYQNQYKYLKYPNITFASLVQNIFDLISKEIPSIYHHYDIKTIIFKKINKTFNINILNCVQHGSDFGPKFLNLITKLLISNYCTSINRLLTGKQKLQPNENDDIKIQAHNRHCKFQKKKKKVQL